MRLHILTVIFFFFTRQSCVYVGEIQPLVPTAVLCTSLMDNSTVFGILELGILPEKRKKNSPLPGWILAIHWYWRMCGWFVYLLE